MKGKIAFILGAGAGYVLGSRAGRERYEQIKRGAQRLWGTAPVQRGVGIVKGAVDDRADDLKAFAIRVGNDVLAGWSKRSTGQSTRPGAAGGADPAGAADRSNTSPDGATDPAAAGGDRS